MSPLDTPLSALPQMKKATLARLAKLEIASVRDLLFHFPSRYENYSEIVPIGNIALGEKCTIEGVVESIDVHRTAYRRMLLTEAMVKDDTGMVRVVWFNEQFVEQNLAHGTKARFSGKVTEDKRGLVFTNPAYEKSSRDATHTGRLVPVYPETYGITSRFFRFHIAKLLETLTDIPDPLPKDLLERLHLPTLHRALRDIHFPESDEATLVARKRFAFDEMFLIQLKSLEMKRVWEGSLAPVISAHAQEIDAFIGSLPFELTKSQRQAIDNILGDLGRTRPMNRLLNGDVGSGKTIVAAIAAYAAALAGYQTAILAPTEVLARQHAESFLALFGELGVPVAFLTREYHTLGREKMSKASLISAIGAGIPKIVIGTHAILEDKVRFHDLAFIVVDEQHRFGVAQRAALQQSITRTDTDLTQTHTDGASDMLLFEDLTYKIRGAIFSVKKQLGLGHKESIYQKALAEELKKIDMPFSKEQSIDIRYDGKKIGTYRPDFIVDNRVIVELEALPSIGKFEKEQAWHHLKGSEYPLALLVNFGRDDVHIERFIHTRPYESASSPHKSTLVAHFLTMTATPIPRTLALAYFGSLDLSLLTDMPKNRKTIITKVAATDADRDKIYGFIRSEIAKGRQAFVIFPLVEESEALEDVKAATAEHTRLAKDVFPDCSLGLLHGRLKAKEKETIMHDFSEGRHHILVSTSVVEVGIDIPNASIMMIEDADRFGLSQLHQFRGRVGRGEHQSYCFLLPGKFGSEENRRLQALAKHASGFDIAEEDLKLRGPGALFGTRQSGLPDIAMENLTNIRLVEIAHKEAAALIAGDPTLENYPLLRKSLATFGEKIHME